MDGNINYLLIIGELLFLLIISLSALVFLYRRTKKLREKLTKIQSKQASTAAPPPVSTEDILRDYFTQQLTQTDEQLNTETDKPVFSQEAGSLRAAYLKLEQAALEHKANSEEFWRHLATKIEPLTNMFSEETAASKQNRAELERQIILLKERIQCLQERVPDDEDIKNESEQAVKNLEKLKATSENSTHIGKQFSRTLERANSVINKVYVPPTDKTVAESQGRQDKKIEHLEYLLEHQKSKIDSLNDYISNTQEKLSSTRKESIEYQQLANQLEGDLQKSQENSQLLQVSIDEIKSKLEETKAYIRDRKPPAFSGGPGDKSFIEDHDNISEINALNQNELKNLRNTIKEQRLLIVSLEKSITELNANYSDESEMDEASKEQLATLNQTLKESETCIQILESEVDYLSEQLKVSKELSGDLDKTAEEELKKQLQKLSQTLAQTEKELAETERSAEQNSETIEFYQSAIDVRSIQDLSLVLIDFFQQLDIDSSFIVEMKKGPFEVSSRGKISTQDRALLNTLELNDISTRNKRTLLAVKLPQLTAILKNSSSESHAIANHKDEILKILHFASPLIEKVNALNQSKKVTNFDGFAKDIIDEVESFANQQSNETSRILEDTLSQILDIAKTLELSPSLIKAIEDLNNEAEDQLDLLAQKKKLTTDKLDYLISQIS